MLSPALPRPSRSPPAPPETLSPRPPKSFRDAVPVPPPDEDAAGASAPQRHSQEGPTARLAGGPRGKGARVLERCEATEAEGAAQTPSWLSPSPLSRPGRPPPPCALPRPRSPRLPRSLPHALRPPSPQNAMASLDDRRLSVVGPAGRPRGSGDDDLSREPRSRRRESPKMEAK